ncbi:hypothetical protein F4820DRAFT_432248 [Hypoxylon rubiginosum]|uniref:Uncharacterized protein n=1 Tax=Hypoxylon rubiginosum TaxID=110542 RepID=A0ACB9YR89_9PEZI|nr:hypothetical protein F4820DRAFT_432248 [Hypoxylon rubiginosum]
MLLFVSLASSVGHLLARSTTCSATLTTGIVTDITAMEAPASLEVPWDESGEDNCCCSQPQSYLKIHSAYARGFVATPPIIYGNKARRYVAMLRNLPTLSLSCSLDSGLKCS